MLHVLLWYYKYINRITKAMSQPKKIKILKNGPYKVDADVSLEKEFAVPDENGDPKEWRKGDRIETEGEYFLCRCGNSGKKPFCDGLHVKAGFDGTETAEKKAYKDQAEIISGPGIDLMDAESFCAAARFCHRCGGAWKLTGESDDPEKKKIAIQQACDCLSGRLTAIDKKTGKPIELEFKPSISVTEDMSAKLSGPLWVKGGIGVESADGSCYETRNRQALCRCGKSKNKPFCDGSHVA